MVGIRTMRLHEASDLLRGNVWGLGFRMLASLRDPEKPSVKQEFVRTVPCRDSFTRACSMADLWNRLEKSVK